MKHEDIVYGVTRVNGITMDTKDYKKNLLVLRRARSGLYMVQEDGAKEHWRMVLRDMRSTDDTPARDFNSHYPKVEASTEIDHVVLNEILYSTDEKSIIERVNSELIDICSTGKGSLSYRTTIRADHTKHTVTIKIFITNNRRVRKADFRRIVKEVKATTLMRLHYSYTRRTHYPYMSS